MYKLTNLMRIGLPVLLLSSGVILTRSALIASGRSDHRSAGMGYQIMLDGSALDYAFFSIFSRGNLTVISGDSRGKGVAGVPFRVYLRRNGVVINDGASDRNRLLYVADVGRLLALAQHGDELIIEPLGETNQTKRQIISVRSPAWPFPPSWLPAKPGC